MDRLPLFIMELQMAKTKLLQSFQSPDREHREGMKLANNGYLKSLTADIGYWSTGHSPRRAGESFQAAPGNGWHCCLIGKMCRKV
jgi:hypothetical protein